MDRKECEVILDYLTDQTYLTKLSKQEKRLSPQKSTAVTQEDHILYHKGLLFEELGWIGLID